MGFFGGGIGSVLGGIAMGPVGAVGGYFGGNSIEEQMRRGGDGTMYMDQPGDLAYTQGYDPKTMSMTPELERRLSGINVDQRGMNKFRGEALRTGPSSWATLANKQQNLEERMARQRAMSEGASGAAGARSQLAMRGGLSSGAKERLARDANKNYLMMSQDIGAQGTKNRGQISMNDEQNRITQLGQLPGMENQAIQGDLAKLSMWGQGRQFDTNQAVNEAGRKNDYNLGRYKEKMAAWGANQQANATAKSGKK
jgi:hypothetical protein